MIVLVTGGRKRSPHEVKKIVLYVVYKAIGVPGRVGERVIIVHGDAEGADQGAKLASQFEKDWGEFRLPAQWTWKGKGAGPIRNREMLSLMRPDIVLAFPSIGAPSPGTWDMVFAARDAGIPVEVCNEVCNMKVDYHVSPHKHCILR